MGEKQINLDQIRLRKAAEDRQQAQDLEDLVSAIAALQAENKRLQAALDAATKKPE